MLNKHGHYKVEGWFVQVNILKGYFSKYCWVQTMRVFAQTVTYCNFLNVTNHLLVLTDGVYFQLIVDNPDAPSSSLPLPVIGVIIAVGIISLVSCVVILVIVVKKKRSRTKTLAR